MKRILSMILALSMLLCALALVACGETPAETTEKQGTSSAVTVEKTKDGTADATTAATAGSSTTAKSGSGTTAATAQTQKTDTASTADTSSSGSTGSKEDGLDGLSKHPDYMDVNFGGKTFNFIVQGWWTGGWDTYEVCAEITGNDDLIDEGIAKRNALIENLYNCKIRQTVCSSYDNGPGRYLVDDMALGKCNYEFCMGLYSNNSCNVYTNIYKTDIDLSHYWWDQDFVDTFSVTIDGTDHLYTLSGPFNLISYDSSYGLFVNKKLYDQLYGSGKIKTDIFEAVKNGTWTFDLFAETAAAAVSDANGDQAMTFDGGDIFGCTDDGNWYGLRSLFSASGVKSIRKTDTGSYRPVSSEDSDYSLISGLIDKLVAFYNSDAVTKIGEEETVKCLANGQSLFNPQYLYRLHNRDEYVTYGVDLSDASISIVPFPKYTESQEGYHSFVCNRAYGVKISRAITDVTEVSQFIEVYAFHSAKILYPAYVKCLKTQCLCDEEAGEMLEIILNSQFYDMGTFMMAGFAATSLTTMVGTQKKNNFSRAIVGVTNTTNTIIDTFIENMKKDGQS